MNNVTIVFILYIFKIMLKQKSVSQKEIIIHYYLIIIY